MADRTPEEALSEAVAWCSSRGEDRRLLLGGDFNLRTNNEQAGGNAPPRLSVDVKDRNTRGRWLLDLATLFGLYIVNGTSADRDVPGVFTSWQHNGQAVVDYILTQAQSPLGPSTFAVTRTSWSDHSLLAVVIPTSSPGPTPMAEAPSHLPLEQSPMQRPLWESTEYTGELNDRVRGTFAMSATGVDAMKRLYGTAQYSPQACPVYITGYYCVARTDGPSATFAIAWSTSSRIWTGTVMALHGLSRLHGELFALLLVARSYPSRTIAVYTSSKPLLSLICRDAPRLCELGFPGPLGPLARLVINAIRRRPGPLIFWDDARVSTKCRLRELRQAARRAWDTRAPEHILDIDAEEPSLAAGPLPLGEGKVRCSLQLDRAHASLARPRGTHSRNYNTHVALARGAPVPTRAQLLVRRIQAENRQRLAGARNSKEWWRIIRALTSAKSRPPQVSLDQLRFSFFRRLNPDSRPPPHFDSHYQEYLRCLEDAIPSFTVDSSPEGFFSRTFTLADMAAVKRRITDRLRSAAGIDRVGYAKILTIPNAALVELFNYCIDKHTIPEEWLVTVLIGIMKKGKDVKDPESYRLVGLESCLLKVFTLLIESRLVAWADTNHIIPDSQNGFRRGRRASTNPFVLSCAIDRARAQRTKLYVVFVDLKNAFPATDLPRLWVKLAAYGVSGPLFDWLRMLYARMRYVVRLGGATTAVDTAFRSLIGVLTGDSASPTLWNLYFADVAAAIPVHVDDIVFAGRPVSHVEHADDVALWSTSLVALQQKLTAFFSWCARGFMTLSIAKTEWMVFGGAPSPRDSLMVNGAAIRLVLKYKFIGIWFSSKGGAAGLFKEHYFAKSKKAWAMASVMFAAHDQLGDVPPGDALVMYWSMVDPHLTFGAEFILDDVASHFDLLNDVQKYFLRRTLGVSARSSLFPRYTETGVMPLLYRRLLLALGSFRRLMIDDNIHASGSYGVDAAQDLLVLYAAGHPCWLSRLERVLARLPVPVPMPSISSALLQDLGWHGALRAAVLDSCHDWLRSEIMATTKCHLLRSRWTRGGDRLSEGGIPLLQLREYLKIKHADHRVALTRLLVSDHPLAVETLRRGSRANPTGVPHDLRLCRFCTLEVEDEAHALVACMGCPRLVEARNVFLADIWAYYPAVKAQMLREPVLGPNCLYIWLESRPLTRRLGAYVHVVFTIFSNTPYAL